MATTDRSTAWRERWLVSEAGHLFRRENFWPRFGVPLAMALLVVAFTSQSSVFLTWANWRNILLEASIIGIASVGATLVLISGGIDISQGPVIALAGIIAVSFLDAATVPGFVAVGVAVTFGAFVGATNGFLAEWVKIPSFMATLAVGLAIRGIAFVWTGGRPVALPEPGGATLESLGRDFLGPLPIAVVVMLALYVVAALVMSQTVWGYHTYAMGSNPSASRLSGLRVTRQRIQIYTLAGMLSATAGVVLAGRLASANPNVAQGAEFDIITAVVVGGTSIFGGRGNVLRTLMGVLFLVMLTNGLILLDISSFYQRIAVGAILIGALALDRLRASTSRR